MSLFRTLLARWPFGLFVAGCGAILVGMTLLIGAPVALLVFGIILVIVAVVEVLT